VISLDEMGNLGQYTDGSTSPLGYDKNGNPYPSIVKRRRAFENYAYANPERSRPWII
jgi:hypothetical protein